MKHVIILPDGAADEPIAELGDRTPLEVARIPNIDRISRMGRLGRALTVPPGFTAGTDVATLSLLGYDPHRYYSGRAPLEAAAQGLTASEDQLIFRCNFATIEAGRMHDFTAGHIAQVDANELIEALNTELADEGCEFHSGVSYRNLMLLSNAAKMNLRCAPPHDIPGEPVSEHRPEGDGKERVTRIMDRAAAVLQGHPVNERRKTTGELPASNIWLWGQGRPIELESFTARYGTRAAAITGVDIIRGIASSMGIELIHVPGATGYIDTDYGAKADAAIRCLSDFDTILVHIEAPDEAGHLGNAAEKIKALERIDELIVGPLLAKLESQGDWRVMVAPDHPTPVATKAHSSAPPPFCMAGTGISDRSERPFTEREAAATGILADPATELIHQLFAR